jgi:phage virion morphogenesis protein
MAQNVSISINDKALRITLGNLNERLRNPVPMLKIAGQVMKSSIERTFRDQGSPAGSWAPLAASTLKRGKGGAGRKILIQSARLKNSVTDDTNYSISGNTLKIGSNLVYAAIHQFGGFAGRSVPSNRTLKRDITNEARGFHGPRNQHGYFGFRRPFIPARPYLVFRPEDPQRITEAIERYIASAEAQS